MEFQGPWKARGGGRFKRARETKIYSSMTVFLLQCNTKAKNNIKIINEMINTLQYNEALFTFIEIGRTFCYPCKKRISRSIK